MLIPNASEIARRKWTVRTCMRATAMLFAALTIWPIASWLTEGFMDGDTLDLSYYADRITLAILCLIVATVAWFMQGLITRVLVPIPKGARCPKCNHRIEGMTEPICTECGLHLTPEFLEQGGVGGAADTRSTDTRITPFLIANRRSIAANIFRFTGIIVIFWALLSVLGSAIMFFMTDPDFFTYAIVSLAQSIAMLLIGIVLTFWSARLSRFCVPMPPDTTPPRDQTDEIPHPTSPTSPCGDGPAMG